VEKSDAYFDDRRNAVCGIISPHLNVSNKSWYRSDKFLWSNDCDFDSSSRLIHQDLTNLPECGNQCLTTYSNVCTHFAFLSSGQCKLMSGLAGKGNAIFSKKGICGIRE